MKRSFYVKCPECGATLDRGERCDCEKLSSLKREQAASTTRRKREAIGMEAVEASHIIPDRIQKYYEEYDYA